MSRGQVWWDYHFLSLAKKVSEASKDPSTKTGAVIVGPDKGIISTGFNGFARRMKDTPERYNNREVKYRMIIHCEMNAIHFAHRCLEGCTLYTWPFQSCSACAIHMIQRGITRAVAPVIPEDKKQRWEEDMKLSSAWFEEAGVSLKLYDGEIV